jgi:hypothetical protein
MPAITKAKQAKGKAKKSILKFSIDCTKPVEDGIMDASVMVLRNIGVIILILQQ